MESYNEIQKFNSNFGKNFQEITVVTGIKGFSGYGDKKLWEAAINITAWKYIDIDHIFKGKYFLIVIGDYKYCQELQNKIKPNSIISLKVRRIKNIILLFKILHDTETNIKLKQILKEQVRPIIYKDEILGKFKLNKPDNVFRKKIKWKNKNIGLYVKKYSVKRQVEAFVVAQKMYKEKLNLEKKIKEFAAEKLLKYKKNSFIEADKINKKKEIVKKLRLDYINISLKNNFSFHYYDPIFGCCISISGSLEKGPLKAIIEEYFGIE